jgi:hypothetical protein
MENRNEIENLETTEVPEANNAILQRVENFLSERYNFRRNVVIEKTEFRLKAETHYKIMKERDYNSLYRQLQKAEIKASNSILFSLLNSDYVEKL